MESIQDMTVAELLWIEQIITYVSVAAATAVLYDHLTTLADEIELVWMRKLSIVKILFIINRYAGGASLIYSASALLLHTSSDFEAVRLYLYLPVSTSHCFRLGFGLAMCVRSNIPFWFFLNSTGLHYSTVASWLSIAALWSMLGIMSFRVSAMYQHRKLIIYILVASTVVAALPTAIAVGLVSAKLSAITTPLSGVSVCIPPVMPNWFDYCFFFPNISQQLLILGLGLFKAISSGEITDYMKENPSSRRPSLGVVLLRDSILYPFLAVITSIFHLIGKYRFNFLDRELLDTLCQIMLPILGCRLVLNLRESYYTTFEHEYNESFKFGYSQPPFFRKDPLSVETLEWHPRTTHSRSEVIMDGDGGCH